MPQRPQVAAAESVFRELGGFPAGADRVPATREVLDAIERFVQVQFEIAAEPDADGLLFHYATLRAASGNGFVLGFLRQFAVPDADPDSEGYVQLHIEYEFATDPDLEAAGRRTDWWFSDGPEPFEVWYGRVAADPVWRMVDDRPATAFAIYQDSV